MYFRHGCAWSLAAALGVAAPVSAQDGPPPWDAVVRGSGPAKADLRLFQVTADGMAAASPAFATMLAILQSAPHVMTFVRATAVSGKLGQTQIYVAAGRTFVMMELNPFRVDPLLRVRAIAHEVAHAAEAACLPPMPSTAALQGHLIERAKQAGTSSLESPFPTAMEQIVVSQYRAGSQVLDEVSRESAVRQLEACRTNVRIRRP